MFDLLQIFFCGPCFFGAVAMGAESCATNASSVVCKVCAITSSGERPLLAEAV